MHASCNDKKLLSKLRSELGVVHMGSDNVDSTFSVVSIRVKTVVEFETIFVFLCDVLYAPDMMLSFMPVSIIKRKDFPTTTERLDFGVDAVKLELFHKAAVVTKLLTVKTYKRAYNNVMKPGVHSHAHHKYHTSAMLSV